MIHLSQNKKIAASAVVVFFVSFSVMLFFLKNSGKDFNDGAANLLAIGHGHENEEHHEFEYSEIEAVKEYFDDENPALILDKEGQIYGASEEFCELLSMECKDVNHALLIDLVHEKDVKDFAKGQAKMLNSKKDIDGLGPYRLSGEEEMAMVILNAHPIVDHEGKAEYIAVSVKDITEDIANFNNEKEEKVSQKNEIQKIVQRISFNK